VRFANQSLCLPDNHIYYIAYFLLWYRLSTPQYVVESKVFFSFLPSVNSVIWPLPQCPFGWSFFRRRKLDMRHTIQVGLASTLVFGLTACSSLPGSPKQQGAVAGGAGGAAIGAAVAPNNRALGAIIGGAVGAAGGYVVGANKDKIFGTDKDEVAKAETNSQVSPATATAAKNAATADVNQDGFVTLDEVVALKEAGFTDAEMIERLRATHQVFTLTPEQKQYLTQRGVSQNIVDQLSQINQGVDLNQPQESVISKPNS
jgi:hypothetical protein